MTLDERIFLQRAEVVGLDDGYEDLEAALHEAFVGATEIAILTGFYSIDRLIDICSGVPRPERAACRIKIAVGLPASALVVRTWEDMRRVEKTLKDRGFRNLEISIVPPDPVHFHTKLVRVLRTTRPTWFIGSYNAGSSRHELMLRFTGRYEALTTYLDAVFETARSVTKAKPPVEIRTLGDFFLAGRICHRPPPQRLFILDAFRFGPGDRATIARALADGVRVDHARPVTQGFGFSLLSALGEREEDVDVQQDGADTAIRLRLRSLAVDTVFGYWLPAAYEHDVRAKVESAEKAERGRLKHIGIVLASAEGRDRARAAYFDYVESLERFIEGAGLEARPFPDHERRFAGFVQRRTTMLTDPDSIRRLARRVDITDMPDLWETGYVARDFTTSFFEDVSHRINSGAKRTGPVVRAILDVLGDGFGDPDGLEEALSEHIQNEGWSEDRWIRARDRRGT